MNIFRTLSLTAWSGTALLSVLSLACFPSSAVQAQTPITFEAGQLASPPPNNPGTPALDVSPTFSAANGGSDTVQGVTFDDRFLVFGSFYQNGTGGSDVYGLPDGSYALTNGDGGGAAGTGPYPAGVDGLTLTTRDLLQSVAFAQNDYGSGSFGADQVTVTAYGASGDLAAASLPLTSTTLTTLSTGSVFQPYAGQITGYRINAELATDYIALGLGGGNYVADDFQFGSTVTPSGTHLLWDNVNGEASVWTVHADGSYVSAVYGPFAGWTARAVAAVPDGSTDLLWTNTDGTAALWNITGSGYTTIQYGPFTNYTAVSLSVGGDGTPHLLWDNTDGTASVWAINKSTGGYTHAEYGPYAGWTANQIASGPSVTDLLWTKTDGTAAGWRIAADGSIVNAAFGPYSGYNAVGLAVGPDNGAHLLWDSAGGAASLWNADFSAGTFTNTNYGPFSGYTARAVATGSDNIRHLLWDKTDGTASLWSVNADGSYAHTEYGPYSGWTAVTLSAGP